ncbi:hypothetical protein STTU_5605 [Streptomyces sp. Tu6071]|nr:hypothetical protein STTU_5605 [Streptomyces sp. Tu6071]
MEQASGPPSTNGDGLLRMWDGGRRRGLDKGARRSRTLGEGPC